MTVSVRLLKAAPSIVAPMIAVDDISALARWSEPGLSQRLSAPQPPPPDWSTSLDDVKDESVLRAAGLVADVQAPLHVIVDDPSRRIRRRGVISHVWSASLPDGALFQLTPRVLIASPAFCLQGIATRYGEVRGALAAMEICGGYGRCASAPGGFYKRSPLATPEQLTEHFRTNHSYGVRHARAAVAHAIAGSRSPMETVVVLLFTLPVELGGCGLPAPRLNVRVEISPELRAAIGKPYVVVDLCWDEQRIILEYDSYLWHSSALAVDSDSTRNEGLRDQGWMVRSVTAGMLGNDAMRRHLVSRVMRRFGRALPSDERFDRLQHDLVQTLLSN